MKKVVDTGMLHKGVIKKEFMVSFLCCILLSSLLLHFSITFNALFVICSFVIFISFLRTNIFDDKFTKCLSFLICILTLSQVCLYVILSSTNFHKVLYSVTLFEAVLVTAVCIVILKKRQQKILSCISALLLLGIMVIHMPWQIINMLISYKITDYVLVDGFYIYMENASICACFGILMFACGLLWNIPRIPFQGPSSRWANGSKILYKLGCYIAAIGFSFLIFNVLRIGIDRFLTYGYSDSIVMSGLGGFFYEGKRLIVIGILFAASGMNTQNKSGKIIVLSATLLFTIMTLVWGIRGFTLTFLCAFYIVWARRIGPLKSKSLILLFIAIIIVYGGMGYTRNIPIKERTIENYIRPITLHFDEILIKPITTPGMQITTLTRALMYVPDTRNYTFGQDYFVAFFQAIPLTVHLSSYLRDYLYSSQWLSRYTILNQAIYWRKYGTAKGTGSTILTEAYMNFGLFGIIIIPFILGLLATRMDSVANRMKGPEDLAMIACIAQALFWWTRNTVCAVPRTLFVVYIIILIYRSIKRRKAVPNTVV